MAPPWVTSPGSLSASCVTRSLEAGGWVWSLVSTDLHVHLFLCGKCLKPGGAATVLLG